jgi:hypothetical protein
MQTYVEAEKKGRLNAIVELVESLVFFAALIGFLAWGAIALVSQDALWFLGGTSLPDPQRIVVRVEGEETVLTEYSPGYTILAAASKKALSSFLNSAPVGLGLSAKSLEDYQRRNTVLEFYYNEPVNFRLPFDDGKPTALLIPIEGRHAGQGYVFRGSKGVWWARPIQMSDPQPIMDAMHALGYLKELN